MRANHFKKKKDDEKIIAKQRIVKLFLIAESEKNYALQKRYVKMARDLGTKFRTRIPSQFKRKYCRFCGAYFIPAKTVQIRLKNQKVIFHCLECNKLTRFPYVREIKAKRKASLTLKNALKNTKK